MTISLLQVHGSCHCGAISYEAVVDTQRVTICHCTDCQELTGSAYRVSVPAIAETFRLIRGKPTVYFKVGASGNRRAQAFCPTCGSSMYTHADEAAPRTYGLRVGCIRERKLLVPDKRIWCSSLLEWSVDLRGVPTKEHE